MSLTSTPTHGPRSITILQDGVQYVIILPNADRDHIQRLLASTGEPYELSMLQDMASRIEPGDLVLDIGANIGNHSLYLAAVAKARVVAFEPNGDLCLALKASIERNMLDAVIDVRQVGIGSKVSTAHFDQENPENLGAQALEIGNGDIEVLPLDSVHLDGTVRAIKIDVEGMELDVLHGAQQRVQADRPILYIECHDESVFRRVARWLEIQRYTYWETFNATPTHLFLPAENVRVDDRIAHLSAQAVIQDYRYGRELRQRRKAESQAKSSIDRLQTKVSQQKVSLESHARTIGALRHETDELRRTFEQAQRGRLEVEEEKIRLKIALATERAVAREAVRQVEDNRDRLRKVIADYSKLLAYAVWLEERYDAVLKSETWRAMAPVREALRILRRRKRPEAFVPKLDPDEIPDLEPSTNASERVGLLPVETLSPRDKMVTVFLATFPARAEHLPAVVSSLLPQCDLMSVYLNDYEEVPACLRHDKIRTTLGKDALGDLKDNGKFFNTQEFPRGYHVFVDDDIAYPPDYVERLVTGISEFGFRAIVGFHGTIYREPLESYVRDRAVMPFFAGRRSAVVDQLGTGTVAYHTSTCLIDLSAFETVGMADLWFAKRAAELRVPMVALSRRDNWLRPMREVGDTLFRRVQSDDSVQTTLLRERLAPALQGGPRLDFVKFIQSLYAPAFLKRSRIDLNQSLSGIFSTNTRNSYRTHFALIITGWNCAERVEECFGSIEHQLAGRYTLDIFAFDDCSTDATWAKLSEQSKVLRISAFRGEENLGPAFARDFLIKQVTNPDTVCVLLDMDDQLIPDALVQLEGAYRENGDCWLTYGNWINQYGVTNDQGTYSDAEIDSRAYRMMDTFKFTHLRSFRRFLYDAVQPSYLKDRDGNWLRYCSDVGLMLPLADQCEGRNVIAFENPMYIYHQYRSSGTQKRFRDKKREMFCYLRDRLEPLPRYQEVRKSRRN